MPLLLALVDVLLLSAVAAMSGAVAGVSAVQAVDVWAPVGTPRSLSRLFLAPLAAVTALLGLLASVVAQALVWFQAIGTGWVWLPAVIGSVGLLAAHVQWAMRVRRSASAE